MQKYQLNDSYSVVFDELATFLVDATGKSASISRELGNLLVDTAEMAEELAGLGCQVAIALDLPELGKCQIEFSNG